MNIPWKHLLRNVLVALVGGMVSILVVYSGLALEVNASEWGETVRAKSEGISLQEIQERGDVLGAMNRSMSRISYLYVPLALLLPALIVAFASSNWTWSWFLTLLGCSPGLAALAVTGSDNLGRGIAVAMLTYFAIASLVTLWRRTKSRRRRPDRFNRTGI